ncbi:3-oxoacyl-[acyl-carrier-protein] synthase 3 [Iodidimonas muriae]|uniref:Beta-ketoacyl-[acyl-carrier-protein] synthase III n=1 Tax=Iodidimonas muriae TaxID=261467 RepID=A0ABQ2LGQ9_9PROT|nr:beta-ketoacyl-ACP synthase III [Iodidimonas muriae]GER08338.1 3-oxoacyl-[acyl-carrier-protein] synthase 3 [Kordiimonadales bacterium JCM 17843]GGO16232.1 3-oxoacyl-[acyl-carrier-protein] synthase 3 [Iodidimonas muriae]
MTVIRSVLRGCGSYLPKRIMSNEDMTEIVDTSDDWIVERTGIRQRHVAHADEKTSDLAINAAKRALEMAGIDGDELDLIVVATATPDETFPATATTVQAALGMTKGFAFDLQAVCSGFVYALATADNFIKAGQVKRALVIGAETFTRILDYEDRTTCVLFGDGAGAVVLEAAEGAGEASDQGILSSHLHSDGRFHDMLYVDGGPSSTGTSGHVRMKGREVFRHAVVNLAAVVEEVLQAVGLESSAIDWLVPHQANRRILDGTAKKLNLSAEKVIVTVDRHANTSAASIPLALDEAVRDGRVKRGDLLLLEAMGGGFTWGACLLRW